MKSSLHRYVFLRIILINILAFAVVFVAFTEYWLFSFWIGLIIFWLGLQMINRVNIYRHELRNFLLYVTHNDFSTRKYEVKTSDMIRKEINEAYSLISEKYQQLQNEREFHHQYLMMILRNVEVALICVNEDMELQFVNEAALQLFRNSNLRPNKSFEKTDPQLFQFLQMATPGKKQLVKYNSGNLSLDLTMRSAEFKLYKVKYRLISFQDIKPELEEKEAESWQKLIRVLTHEILNSAIPIANLSELLEQILFDKEGNLHQIDPGNTEEISDLKGSVQTIKTRSRSLAEFIKGYSNLTKTPAPVLMPVRIEEMFFSIRNIFKPETDKLGIRMSFDLADRSLEWNCDRTMTEQVMINLVKNALEALVNTPEPAINISANQEEVNGKVSVSIKDNGPGIPAEIVENIFVPFFSTKPKGSGIGLTLSRQLIRKQGGTISVFSEPGSGTEMVVVI
jgi:two-component system, NtrC family, nitrogen regulation sensor histidine kinase NtrY